MEENKLKKYCNFLQNWKNVITFAIDIQITQTIEKIEIRKKLKTINLFLEDRVIYIV